MGGRRRRWLRGFGIDDQSRPKNRPPIGHIEDGLISHWGETLQTGGGGVLGGGGILTKLPRLHGGESCKHTAAGGWGMGGRGFFPAKKAGDLSLML